MPWCVANYGDPDLAPWTCRETDPPEDEKARAETRKTKVDTLTAAAALSPRVDIDHGSRNSRIRPARRARCQSHRLRPLHRSRRLFRLTLLFLPQGRWAAVDRRRTGHQARHAGRVFLSGLWPKWIDGS